MTKGIGRVLWILSDRNFLFIAAIVLGILTGSAAHRTEPWTLPALVVAMTASMTQVESSAFRSLGKLLRATAISVLLNYVILGAAILIPARLLLPERELWIGFVIAAAAPPGVGVIPFTHITGGDVGFSLLGIVGTYVASLVITPAMAFLLIGENVLDPRRLAVILLQLIVVPLVASRLLLLVGPLKAPIERWRGKIVNWAFTIVVFTIIGLNREVFFSEPRVVLLILLITLTWSFGLGFAIDEILKRLGVERARRMSYLLMGTVKNGGFAAATALALFGERAAVPNGVGAAIAVPYLLWLGIRWGRKGE